MQLITRTPIRKVAEAARLGRSGVSEEITGRLLREIFSRREEYVIATKVCGPTGSGANDLVLDAVADVAGELGVQPAQVALHRVMAKSEVTAPIVGATKLAHPNDAIATAEIELSNDRIERLEAPYRPRAWQIYARPYRKAISVNMT